MIVAELGVVGAVCPCIKPITPGAAAAIAVYLFCFKKSVIEGVVAAVLALLMYVGLSGVGIAALGLYPCKSDAEGATCVGVVGVGVALSKNPAFSAAPSKPAPP